MLDEEFVGGTQLVNGRQLPLLRNSIDESQFFDSEAEANELRKVLQNSKPIWIGRIVVKKCEISA